MRIRNKLFLANAFVFLLFILIFSVFIYSAFALLDLKDLEKKTASVRNSILKLEYANRSILNSENIPLHVLDWAGQNVSESLEDLLADENLRFLKKNTQHRIEIINDLYLKLDFPAYFHSIASELNTLRPILKETTAEIEYRRLSSEGNETDPLFIKIYAIRSGVQSFVLRHRPLSDGFISIAIDIQKEVSARINRIMIQTGITLFLGIIISIILIIFVYRGMTSNLNHVRSGIQRISSGELTLRINDSSKDELADIARNFNILTETIWQKLNTIGSIIHNMGQSLTDESESAVLEQTILNLAIENTHAIAGALYLPNHEEQTLSLTLATDNYAAPYSLEDYPDSIPFGKTALGISVSSEDPLFFKDLKGQNIIPIKTPADPGYISSCMILPLINERTIIALICLTKNEEDSLFSDMDYTNILSFIEFSAVTMNNLNKYNELLMASGLNREMEIASDIQKSLLPPRVPKIKGFDISVKTYSLKGISGDIYDFFPLGQNRWLFCMAEVMEKGIASSMLLVILRTLVRILVKADQEPAEMMNNILDNFRDTMGLGSQLKISLLLMEADTKGFQYCGTEGLKLLLFDKRSDTLKMIEAKQKSEQRYITIKGNLRKDVYLGLMTDGFYNTQNEHGDSYGWDPIHQIIKKYSDRSVDWMQDAINKDIAHFERNLEQRDDRTLFIAQFKGTQS